MQFVWISVVAGIVGTAGMILVLWLITRSGWANADMVRALGSALRGSQDSSFALGALIQTLGGIPIAVLYLVMLSLTQVDRFFPLMATGALIGFVHGFMFSFMLLMLAQHHPVERFRHASFEIAVAHIIGHVVYGVLVGAVIGASGYQIQL